VKRYDSLANAGFDLENHSNNYYIFVMVKDTWTPGGGRIQGAIYSVGGAGGTGGVPGLEPFGGAGGSGRYAVFVFARTTVGTGEVNASGTAGVTAPNAPGQGGSGNGTGSNPSVVATYAFGNTDGCSSVGTFGSSGLGDIPGPPSPGGLRICEPSRRTFRNLLATTFISQDSVGVGAVELGQPWAFAAMGSPGGGQGGNGSIGTQGGGGSGGGGSGFYGHGGAGGGGGGWGVGGGGGAVPDALPSLWAAPFRQPSP
jgi:hypothetical protein